MTNQTLIKNWNGRIYTLNDVARAVHESEEDELDINECFDGDLGTVPTILLGLVERIRELESADKTSTPVLMSRDNPKGWKLEDLLTRISNELSVKNDLISDDECDLNKLIRANNVRIIEKLHESRNIQNQTMKLLDERFGPNQDPTQPRIGK